MFRAEARGVSVVPDGLRWHAGAHAAVASIVAFHDENTTMDTEGGRRKETRELNTTAISGLACFGYPSKAHVLISHFRFLSHTGDPDMCEANVVWANTATA